jgi:predicted nuclease of predicted toxin-antitoxin system
VAEGLSAAGHDAVHVSDLGLCGATDIEVMDAAVEEGRVVVSADTDFGELLAKSVRALPSVVLLRRHHDPRSQVAAILGALRDVSDALDADAVVVITDDRVRLRSLPIG